MKKLLLILVMLMVCGRAWATNYCSSAQGCYTFPEGSGTTTADQSSNGNNGTFTSSGHPAWSSTVPNFAISGSALNSVLYASSDYIGVTQSSSINNLSAITISAWGYATSLGGGSLGRIVSKSPGFEFYVGSASNVIRFTVGYSSTALTAISSTTFTLNTWHCFQVTWDGSTTATNIHIYIDGTEVSYTGQTNAVGTRTSDSSATLYLGNNSTFTRGFGGNLTQIAIFNSVLSGTQLKEIYDYGLGGSGGNSINVKLNNAKINNAKIN